MSNFEKQQPTVNSFTPLPQALRRRAFLGRMVAGAALLTPAAALLANPKGKGKGHGHGNENGLTRGDAALLRFAAAAEIIETDFWVQYNELGGIQDSEEPDGSGNTLYTAALSQLDGDMDQYIHDNTEDERSHFTFLNAYLASKGAETVSLEQFRTLQATSSTAAGSSRKPRITNLTQLTVDTSWWSRYRDPNHNPDLEPNFQFPQAVPTLAVNQHTAIPRNDNDTSNSDFLQAIANTAGFHFATIEQGGNSLYPAMAQRATSPEVLRILISIGPTETMHFQTWQDKAGNAIPLTNVVDPMTGISVTFPDLTQPSVGEDLKSNLIMPEPCPFLSSHLPKCSIIRPTETNGIAMGVVQFLTDMGLFIGQPPAFFAFLHQLAQQADAAQREDDEGD
jgi:Ferritin-like domain